MESWSFPPRYAPDYLPSPQDRYWFPKRETMPAGEREQAIVERLREVMHYAYAHSSFYRNRWDEAGVHPDHIRSLEAFERVPVITKAALLEAQMRAEPFGDYLCIPDSEVHHIHGTSGTTGRPTVFALGRADWDAAANAHARVMWGAGIRPGDTVFVAAIFSLYVGSWGILFGAERLRAKSFPFGAGASGMTARAARWLNLTRPRAMYCTPSYALHLAEVAAGEGFDPRAFGLEIMMFSGEPGASIPSIRARLEEAFGAKVIDCGTMGEMTPWLSASGSQESSHGMLLWQDLVYHEVCDPVTYARVPYGQQGTPVYTHLERTSQPMIRLASGDLTHWVNDRTPCGRTYPSLPKGIYGRIDDSFNIRGENVYPSDVDAALNKLTGYGGEHRIIITREGTMDEFLVRLDARPEVYAGGKAALEDLRQQALTELHRGLGLRPKVEVVAADEFPRTDHKARRVIDDRALFRELMDSPG